LPESEWLAGNSECKKFSFSKARRFGSAPFLFFLFSFELPALAALKSDRSGSPGAAIGHLPFAIHHSLFTIRFSKRVNTYFAHKPAAPRSRRSFAAEVCKCFLQPRQLRSKSVLQSAHAKTRPQDTL
jgi:hypothetical protein